MEIPLEFPRSRPVIILNYQEDWPEQFRKTGMKLRNALGSLALRIDHIGSTSVPGLAAKDIIDIQITVENLTNPQLDQQLSDAGFLIRRDVQKDDFVGIADPNSPELRKKYVREREGEKRTHIHIREKGRFNQRFPLIFRDYLRSSREARLAYEAIKKNLATLFPQSIDGYLYIKDPVMDLVYSGAVEWAKAHKWTPGDTDI